MMNNLLAGYNLHLKSYQAFEAEIFSFRHNLISTVVCLSTSADRFHQGRSLHSSYNPFSLELVYCSHRGDCVSQISALILVNSLCRAKKLPLAIPAGVYSSRCPSVQMHTIKEPYTYKRLVHEIKYLMVAIHEARLLPANNIQMRTQQMGRFCSKALKPHLA